jgi:RNA polymerase sigma-70 factor (ECF subfamily)
VCSDTFIGTRLLTAAPETDLGHLARRYRPALMSYFLRRVRSHAEAEDLTQDVFMRLTRLAAQDFKSADAYIFRTAANLLADRARRNKVRRLHASEQITIGDLGVDPLDPERVSEGRRSLLALADRLKLLPERARAMFMLYRVEGMNKRAIAEAFDCSVSTVEKQVALVIARLMLTGEDQQ